MGRVSSIPLIKVAFIFCILVCKPQSVIKENAPGFYKAGVRNAGGWVSKRLTLDSNLVK